jgi:hypothetical protein
LNDYPFKLCAVGAPQLQRLDSSGIMCYSLTYSDGLLNNANTPEQVYSLNDYPIVLFTLGAPQSQRLNSSGIIYYSLAYQVI